MSNIKVGSIVYYYRFNRGSLPNGHHPLEQYTVNKIGNKWIYSSCGDTIIRFDKKTLLVDGGEYSSPGKIYLRIQEYEEYNRMSRAWDELRELVSIPFPGSMPSSYVTAFVRVIKNHHSENG